MSYQDFIAGKHRRASDCGIDVSDGEINPYAFEFQRAVIKWACKKGRAAIFADCGLGKSLMALDWLTHMIPRANVQRGILLTPVAVAPQMVAEAEKFGVPIPCKVVREQSECIDGINVTNYERLHKFDPDQFGAVVLDESSILKSFAGATKRALCEAFFRTQFRLATTATPSPNDNMELGNQADFLGIMPSNEMLSRWFINDTMNVGGYRLKGHAKKDFWRWVASWAMVIRKPSDIGFSDDGYELPSLNIIEHVVESLPFAGQLFANGGAVTATTVHKEKRASLQSKCQLIASVVNSSTEAWSVWCDTDYEADELTKAIPEAIEVRGSHPSNVKTERLQSFTNGNARVIITKPEIGGFGLNWQHCHNTTYPAGFSFEKWYQSVRRHWRFGQQHPVNVHLVSSENESNVVAILKEKQQRADEMAAEMVDAMREEMQSELNNKTLELNKYKPSKAATVPAWLQQKREQLNEVY